MVDIIDIQQLLVAAADTLPLVFLTLLLLFHLLLACEGVYDRLHGCGTRGSPRP